LRLYLVHHGEAVGPDVDVRRPLSPEGREWCEQIAIAATARGMKPDVVWHSGKLRAKQTAEIFWRASNPLAELAATRDLQPEDPAGWIRDRLRHETRAVLVAGHFTHLPRLLALLRGEPDGTMADFPPHGVVAMRTDDEGESWIEEWRLGPPGER
jgi:phosphohistidine phosphatase